MNSFWVFGVWFIHIPGICECFDCFRGHTHYPQYYYKYCIVAIYDVCSSHIVSIRTGLKSTKNWDWSAVIHTYHFSKQQPINWKMGRDLVRVAVYQSTTMRRRMIRVGAPIYGRWLAQNSPTTVENYIDKVDKTLCTWPFQAKNRYDVRLANRRAPGVWFALGFRTYSEYLFWAPK